MNKPKLQPEHLVASASANPTAAEIVEVHNLTLKEALRTVRALADLAQSNDPEAEVDFSQGDGPATLTR